MDSDENNGDRKRLDHWRRLSKAPAGCHHLGNRAGLGAAGDSDEVISPGPASHSQLHCGHHGKQFHLHKLSTMVVDAKTEGASWPQPGDPRIIGVGRCLRKTWLDELSQWWYVVVDDTSFVGPRPERPDFVSTLEKKIPYYDLRHLAKPGITGWAQVMCPYGASVEDAKNRLEFDLY